MFRKTRMILVLLLIISLIVGFMPSGVFAQVLSKPFGGLVLAVIPCPCSGNAMIIVSPPRGGRFMMDFGTKLYANYSPTPGNWVLGLADAYVPCLIPILVGCAPLGGGARIRMVGTS